MARKSFAQVDIGMSIGVGDALGRHSPTQRVRKSGDRGYPLRLLDKLRESKLNAWKADLEREIDQEAAELHLAAQESPGRLYFGGAHWGRRCRSVECKSVR